MPHQDLQPAFLVKRNLIRNDSGELLILRRSLEDKVKPGMWEFPGGKPKVGQNLRQAGEEEAMEEAGLVIEPTSPLCYVEDFIIEEGPYKGIRHIAVFGLARVVRGQLRLSEEHYDGLWCTDEKALGYNLTPQSRNALSVLGDAALRAVASHFLNH